MDGEAAAGLAVRSLRSLIPSSRGLDAQSASLEATRSTKSGGRLGLFLDLLPLALEEVLVPLPPEPVPEPLGGDARLGKAAASWSNSTLLGLRADLSSTSSVCLRLLEEVAPMVAYRRSAPASAGKEGVVADRATEVVAEP